MWTDPAGWPGGPIAAAELHGAFEVGAMITVRVKGGPPVRSTITRIESPRVWVSVAKQPGLTMTYEHLIEPVAGGTVLTDRLILTGPFAAMVPRLPRPAPRVDDHRHYRALRGPRGGARSSPLI
jgi:hypothetical protein